MKDIVEFASPWRRERPGQANQGASLMAERARILDGDPGIVVPAHGSLWLSTCIPAGRHVMQCSSALFTTTPDCRQLAGAFECLD